MPICTALAPKVSAAAIPRASPIPPVGARWHRDSPGQQQGNRGCHSPGTGRITVSGSSGLAEQTEAGTEFASDLYGAFPVKRLFWVVLIVFCSERERPFFVPSPAIRFAERAEGVKGPKR